MADTKATMIQGESFYKSLSKLEEMAGLQQQAADSPNPELIKSIQEKMEKGGELTDEEKVLVKSQICTGPNSKRSEWEGGSSSDVPGNGPGADDIKEDGTDYNERGMRKAIQEKVEKGIPLTADELSLLKGDLDKSGGDDINKGDDAKDDSEKEQNLREKMGKSFEAEVQQNDTLQKGIEVSEFLSELAKAFGSGLQGIESRNQTMIQEVATQLLGNLQQFASEQGEFNKSLAEAVVNIGHGVAGSIQQVEQVSQQPAAPPKSQLQVVQGGQPPGQPMSKSFAGPQGQDINKSQMLDAMNDMLEKGETGMNPLEIIKFETTGYINPALQNRVLQRIQAGGR